MAEANALSGDPPIDFVVHQSRTRSIEGARADFERMVVQLVQALRGDAYPVEPHPGDWGIDVAVGRLDDEIEVWQVKYFPGVPDESQKQQIRDSFGSAMRARQSQGHQVSSWTLCMPCSFDLAGQRWWQKWKAKQEAAHGLTIDLWDKSRLRGYLARPEAAHVRRAYYGDPFGPAPGTPHVEPPPRLSETVSPWAAWEGGAVRRLGTDDYLLIGEVVDELSPDRTFRWRDATAELIEPGTGRVVLRQVAVRAADRVTRAGAERRQGLQAQAELLRTLRNAEGIPRLLNSYPRGSDLTLVTSHPPGRSWGETFGPGHGPLDVPTVAIALRAAAALCTVLNTLHRAGQAHRWIRPSGVMLGPRGRLSLRDVGLAGFPPVAGEGGPYRAPEQSRLTSPADLRSRVDIYQVAALVEHTLTGHPPSPGLPVPMRAFIPALPPELEDVIGKALDLNPEHRLPDLRQLTAAFRTAGDALARGNAS